jgi:dehydratase medium subunit
MASRIVRIARSLDVGNVAWTAADLSGSLVGIGLQGKGTAVIHRADLPLLANLELYSNAALVDAGRYRALGRNAARYARGANPEPVLLPESSEPFGPRYHARVVALVAAERACVRPVDPVEVEVTWN